MKKSRAGIGRVWPESLTYGFVENHLVFVRLEKFFFASGVGSDFQNDLEL
jgi:hypothetical protein